MEAWAKGEVSIFDTVTSAAKEMAAAGADEVGKRFNKLLSGIKSDLSNTFDMPKAETFSLGGLPSGTTAVAEAGEKAASTVSAAFKSAADGIRVDFRDVAEGTEGVFASIGQSFKNSILNSLNDLASNALSGAVGGIFGGIIPGFASGGRPPVGAPSIVGEEGRELFVADRPGTILSNLPIRMIHLQASLRIKTCTYGLIFSHDL